MNKYTILLSFLIFLSTTIYSIYHIEHRKKKPIIIVNIINIVLSCALFVLELVRNVAEFGYSNYYLTQILILLTIGNLINSLLVKYYQEIHYKYNLSTLLVIFSVLTIIFCLYMAFYSKSGDFTLEGFILLVVAQLLYFIAGIFNIYFTFEIIDLLSDDIKIAKEKNIANSEVIVVRRFEKSNIVASFVVNCNYKNINKKAYYTICFYYLIAVIFLVV